MGGSLTADLKLFWPQILFISASIAFLQWLLSDPGPPTRLTVLAIASAVGCIVLSGLTVVITKAAVRASEDAARLSAALAELSGRTVALGEGVEKQGRQTIEVFRAVTGAIETLAEETQKKPPKLAALRDAVKRLLGE